MIISSLAITTLLILIAGGWTISYSEFPVPELYVPAIFLLTFLHLFMTGFGFLHESEKYSFTKYEGVSGIVIIIMRAIMYIWFIINLYFTSKNKDLRKYKFIHNLGIGASLYFLSVPLLMIGSLAFPPHLREKVMVGGTNAIQSLAFYVLIVIFTGKGEYHKINSTFEMLPGARSHTY